MMGDNTSKYAYARHSWANKLGSGVEQDTGSDGAPGTVRFECKLEPQPVKINEEQDDLLTKLRQTTLDAMRKFVKLEPVFPLVDQVEMQKNNFTFFKTGKKLTPAELSRMSHLLEKYFKSCFDTQRLHYDNQDRSGHKINLVHVRFLTSPTLAFKFSPQPKPTLQPAGPQPAGPQSHQRFTPLSTQLRPRPLH